MDMSRFLTILGLTDEQRAHPPRTLSRLKTVEEWFGAALDMVKDNKDFTGALKAASPWAEAVVGAAKDSIPPIKFLTKLLDELTKVQEPQALARLACTLAYQAAVEDAVRQIGLPPRESPVGTLSLTGEDVDFENFTLEGAVSHPCIDRADRFDSGFG
jgi:hypothetical protein